ncbi:MAG TPA: S26 family signal peptidase [Thermoplasmata archaeon]|jgi:signal peptidase|nr:S26 family signal peptidase [Thermoplasmata archaeon]
MARGSGLFRDKEEKESGWKGLARDAVIAAVIVVVVLAALYAYAGVWPPLVVVESKSMQHSDRDSSIGVIDTGDMVFQQEANTRDKIKTYVEGRASGYSTYGDFGDVIIFRQPQNSVPIIHRAILYVTLHIYNVSGSPHTSADVPDVQKLPTTEWSATNRTGATDIPVGLTSLTIRHMGLRHDTNLTFTFDNFLKEEGRAGFVTMGDNNMRGDCIANRDCSRGYDNPWVPKLEDVHGVARLEIPWLGLLKLTLQPTESCCQRGWGDPEAPKNSWDSLLVTLIFLFALPFLLEYAGRGWVKYVSPRLPEVNWPWKRRKIRMTSPMDPDEPGEPGAEGNPSTWDEPLDDEIL